MEKEMDYTEEKIAEREKYVKKGFRICFLS